jgi:flagellar M-ring protein FliF
VNFEQFFARLKNAFNALSGKQLGTMAVAFVLVVGLTIGSAYWLNQPTYGVLFADMDPEAASTMTSKLKTAKVDYALDQGGRTIRVPLARVDELRLQFASDGITGMARPGFDLFDGVSFGVTDFQEHVNYRRALEGELARTIGTISEVAGARVHIAMPQPSLFTSSEQPTKASVILKLRGNRALAPSTITAITGLVAASIEQLRPEHVVIVDNYGRPLSKPSQEDDGSGAAPVERQQRIEHDLTSRVVALLEPIVGVGHVRVNVSAKLNTGSEEQTEERFDPNPILRSTKTSTTSSGMPLVAQGVAGVASNLPPDPARPPATTPPAAAPGASANSHREETLNYDLSKVTRHTLQPRGDIKRLSVAVLLDDVRQPSAVQNGEPASATVKPRTPEDLQKIQGLVSAAVGFDSERGDQITVENIAFEETPVQEVGPGPGVWQQYGPQAFEALRIVGVVVLGTLAIFMVIRPMVRSTLTATPVAKGALAPAHVAGAVGAGMPRTVQDLEAEMDAQMSSDTLKMPMMTRRMAALTQKEPESAARLLRTWLNQEQ